MSTDSFSWLHLTDLHYGLKGQDCLWPNLRQPFLEHLGALHDRCGPWDAVFFTGDLVQSGESAQFERMEADVLGPLWERLADLGSRDAVLLAVPGNHDLHRPDPDDDDAAVDTLLRHDGFQGIAGKFWDKPNCCYRRVIQDAFAAYSQWWEHNSRRPAGVTAGTLPGDFAVTIDRGDLRIGIVGLNTAFLQLQPGNYKGCLVWDPKQLGALFPAGIDLWTDQHDLCLLLTHQGTDWLTDEAQGQSVEIAPPGRFAAHLFGHMHEAAFQSIRRGGGGHDAVLLCQGCSVFGMERRGDPPQIERAHGYAAGRILCGEPQPLLRLWPSIATNKLGGWRFIPDHDHGVLESDDGTAPEPLSTRSRKDKSIPVPPPTPARLVPIPAGPHSTLPAPQPFFGRRDCLAKIAQYLTPENRGWGVVLDGPGGVGKTALALEAAHRAPAEHFPLKLWITAKNRELRPEGEFRIERHRVGDLNAMLAELGRALARDDIPRASPEDRPDLVRHALAEYRALLVLDNLETFSLEERREVFELLNRLPRTCRAIVTSRRRVGSSVAAYAMRLDKLEREAADELLDELGRRWSPFPRLTPDERARLYLATGGNPLLLTWTAGQLGLEQGRCRTVAEAIERLQKADRLQRINEENDPLNFIFSDLVETFTDDQTAVLAALTHFTQPAAIEWLLPLTDLSRESAETALDDLRNRALVVGDDQAGTWLLPPLAVRYLRRVRPEAVGTSGERLAEQACALALENGYEAYNRFPVLEDAWPQIDAALPLLGKGDNRRLQALCDALRQFLDFTGRWDERLALSIAAEIRAEREGDLKHAGRRAFDAGWAQYRLGCATEVLKWAERAAGHWEAAGARERAAAAIRLRGEGHRLNKDYAHAISDFKEALELSRSLSPGTDLVGHCFNSLAKAYQASGKLVEAEGCFQDALAVARSLPDPNGVAAYTGHLAELALDRRQWPEAEHLASEALDLDETIQRRELIARDSRRLAKALARQGRGAEGYRHAERAVTIFTELRSPDLTEAQVVLQECLA